MVGGVMAFSVRPVREVMTPRTEIVAIEENAPLDDIRAGLRAERLQPDPGLPRHARRDRRHGARLRPLQARAGRPAAGASGGGHAGAAGAAATCCSTCSASGATSPSCSTSSAARSASRRSRTCWRSWSARSSTSTTTRCGRAAAGGPALFETDGNLSPRGDRRALRRDAARRPLDHGGGLAGRMGRPDSRRRRAVHRSRGLEFDVLQASPTRIERLLIRAGAATRGAAPPGRAHERDPDDNIDRMVELVRKGEIAAFVRRAHDFEAGRPGRRALRARRAGARRGRAGAAAELSSQALAEMPEEAHAGETLAALDAGAGRGDRRGAGGRRRGRHPRRAGRRSRSGSSRRSRTGADVDRLLRYDEETAGGLMTTHTVTVRDTATVAQALGRDPPAGRGGRGLLPGLRGGRGLAGSSGILPFKDLVDQPARAAGPRVHGPTPTSRSRPSSTRRKSRG